MTAVQSKSLVVINNEKVSYKSVRFISTILKRWASDCQCNKEEVPDYGSRVYLIKSESKDGTSANDITESLRQFYDFCKLHPLLIETHKSKHWKAGDCEELKFDGRDSITLIALDSEGKEKFRQLFLFS